MWNKNKSLLLSRLMTVSMSAVILILCFFVPPIAKWYTDFSDTFSLLGKDTFYPAMIVCSYLCLAMALCALYFLHILLKNINKNEVFVENNTKCLRAISWSLILAGFFFAVFALWALIAILPAVFCFMIGIVIRVMKNVFEKAVEIKSENDFTI